MKTAIAILSATLLLSGISNVMQNNRIKDLEKQNLRQDSTALRTMQLMEKLTNIVVDLDKQIE